AALCRLGYGRLRAASSRESRCISALVWPRLLRRAKSWSRRQCGFSWLALGLPLRRAGRTCSKACPANGTCSALLLSEWLVSSVAAATDQPFLRSYEHFVSCIVDRAAITTQPRPPVAGRSL